VIFIFLIITIRVCLDCLIWTYLLV
jgi:hypothetical protein